ncbi:hypothetical protein [Paenibacillus sp. RUD330]|uniref:hypothetical protein n=1 Tax=Paenibacillus sp. RUD330 TaxID=2023772 RepID=UPI000B92580D|nr:hypothetical protein [Paenibacillus sp. RUD330]ASS66210.1 hypothetical protein CIC07_08660 [Paenibacillus sp. RUD330]
MGQITFARPSGTESVAELADMVAKMQKTVEFIVNGNLSTSNVREISGWMVDPDRFYAADGDVGISTAEEGEDPVRFWAGATVPEMAPWRVTKSGKGVATGMLIKSADDYPMVVMDPLEKLFGAYRAADQSITMETNNASFTGAPVLLFTDGSNIAPVVFDSGGLQIATAHPIGITLVANTLDLQGNVNIGSFTSLSATLEGKTLGAALDEKAKKSAQTLTAGAANCGIPIGAQIMTVGGSSYAWQGVPNHTHTQQ